MLSIPKTDVKREEKRKGKKNESKANPVQSSHYLREAMEECGGLLDV